MRVAERMATTAVAVAAPEKMDALIYPGFDGLAFLESSGVQRGGNNAQQLSGRGSQAGRRHGALRHQGRAARRDLRDDASDDLQLAEAGEDRPRRGARAQH